MESFAVKKYTEWLPNGHKGVPVVSVGLPADLLSKHQMSGSII